MMENAGALIYCTKTNRYLFLLRNGHGYSGTWGLPGGKMEQGELASDALAREIEEELGGVISGSKLIPIETFASRNGFFFYYTFLITVEEEFLPELNSEHRGFAWTELTDHPRPLHPGVWRTINAAGVDAKLKTAIGTAANIVTV